VSDAIIGADGGSDRAENYAVSDAIIGADGGSDRAGNYAVSDAIIGADGGSDRAGNYAVSDAIIGADGGSDRAGNYAVSDAIIVADGGSDRAGDCAVSDAIIVVENLTHIYKAGALRQAAIVDVSLTIARGSVAAIIGVTGSGKSTLVQHFNGLLRPTSGHVVVDGIDVQASGADLRALRRRVGMVFQFPEAQLFGRNVFADVAFGPQRMGLAAREVQRRVVAALDLVGLPYREYAARSPFELSGGQMRRVALAGVLALAPALLVLDEPTVGLDAAGRAEFYAYLRRVRREQGATILLVSHDMAEVAALAEWVIVLHAGRLVLQGTPRALFAQADRLRECGLVPPPLAELLALLRGRGLAIPDDVFTLDEAFAALQRRRRTCK